MTSLDDDGSNADGRQLADALGDVSTHIIGMILNDDDEDSLSNGLLSHMANIEDIDEWTAFTATLQKATTIHALTAG